MFTGKEIFIGANKIDTNIHDVIKTDNNKYWDKIDEKHR